MKIPLFQTPTRTTKVPFVFKEIPSCPTLCKEIAVLVKEGSDRSVFSLFLHSSPHSVSTMIILLYIQFSRLKYWVRAHVREQIHQRRNEYLQFYAVIFLNICIKHRAKSHKTDKNKNFITKLQILCTNVCFFPLKLLSFVSIKIEIIFGE